MKKLFLLSFCFFTFMACAQNPQKGTEVTPEEQYQIDVEKLNSHIIPVNQRAVSLNEEIAAHKERFQNDEAYQEEMMAKFEKLQDEINTIFLQFIKKNPQSDVSVEALGELLNSNIPFNELEALYNSLDKQVKDTERAQMLRAFMDDMKLTAIGSVAPDFTQKDPDDKLVKLSDFRGKYVLLDFWASWCGPCRKENPHVVTAYNRFKDKNFEILGVSLDNPGQKQAWLNAVKKDGLTWPQVSDLQGWKNSAAQLYKITTIPQNYLIDPDGVIIARNLRGNDLVKKLASILE